MNEMGADWRRDKGGQVDKKREGQVTADWWIDMDR